MKQKNKQLKRRLMNMCSDKNDIIYPHAGNKKKRTKETLNKNKDSFGLWSESSSRCHDFINENVQNKNDEAKTFKDVQVVRPQNKGLNEKKLGEFCNSDQMFLNDGHQPVLNRNNGNINLTRRGCTGSNNWEKFLIGQGKEFVINQNTDQPSEKQKTKALNSSKNHKLTKVVGMDCEMVGAGNDGKDNLLARVSIVNLYGDCLYDKFVKPRETVTDYRTHISGVRAEDLKQADDFESVQKEVAALIKGRILVGHAIKNDLEVLYLSHPRHQVRDTAKFFRKKGSGTPSLKNLAAEYLGVKIQSGEHSSVQDAQAAVQLYNMYRKQWETGGGNKKNNRIDSSHL